MKWYKSVQEDQLYVLLIYGPAGGGKTTLTAKFSKWLRRNVGAKTASVNLDAGILKLPYKPTFDIRDFVRAEDLMEKYGLGPNGALMRSVEETERHVPKLLSEIDGRFEYVLVDTPGIMEVFTGRDVGRRIVERISRKFRVIGVFVMDASAVERASELIYFRTLCVLGSLKLGLTTIPIWNKIDIATRFKKLISASSSEIAEELSDEKGLYVDAALTMAEMTSRLEQAVRIIEVDSISGRGLDELYETVHETFCVCGDLT